MSAPTPAPVRPDVLALPTSTTLRMVVVAAALVVSALFVGTALHNALLGQAWDQAVLGCLGPGGLLSPEQLSCQAPAERRRAAVALVAAGVAVVLAAVLVAVVPALVRRRRRLVPADPRFARAVAAVADLAAADGVRTPGVLIVPGAVAEPFCLGRPGDYRIAVPRKLALLGNPALFDALLRHEVAHLAHRDVALSWLARSLWYVLGPLLALPVLVTLVRGEPALALDILWRGAVLLGVVLLIVRGLIRAREYDADLHAARVPGVGDVLDAELARRPPGPTGWRAAVAWHPGEPRRRAVLADPTAAAAMTWLDGLTLGFLVALALPIVAGIASALLLDVPVAGLVALIGALLLGPLFGATVGVGLWRDALAARSSGRRPGTGLVALGVLAGGLLGQLASLAGVGLGALQLLLLVPLALAGTTVLVGGLGELWVQGIGRTRRPAAVWGPAALLGAATATAALWAAPQAQLALDGSGWALLAAWLTAPGALVLPGVVAVLLAGAAAWTLRPARDGSVPGWWGPSGPAGTPGRGAVLVGLVAGLAGGIVLFVHRTLAGAVTSDADAIARVDAAGLGSALVGVAVVVVLGVARGPAGAAAGLLAGPVAALTSGVLFLVTVAVVARPLLDGRVASAAAFSALQAENPPAAVAAARIRTEILPLLRQMLDGAQSVQLDDPEVLEVHQHAIDGAQQHVRGFELLVEALDRGDQQLSRQASALLADGNAEWEQWAVGVEQL